MSTLPGTIQLAGEILGEHRHVCALVDGPDDGYELLAPFVLDGLEQGDRALQFVDPDHRDGYLERLSSTGVDVPVAMASRQLEVQTWTETYLRGGRFDHAAQLAYMQAMLRQGPPLGYARTRILGTIDWAQDADTIRDLLVYEASLDRLLANQSDVVVCIYDLNKHSARTIADVLGVHPVAIVGGVLRTNRGTVAVSARDRLLTAASQLFSATGIQATGVDTLIRTAGVAKATFYRHFPSKDDLVVAWLHDRRTRWFDDVRAAVEANGATAADRIPLFFDAVGDWLETTGYRGCSYLNTASELTDPAHPAHAVVSATLQEIEDYLVSLVAGAGYADARRLAAELQTLTAGAISLAVARRSGGPVLTARSAAMSLLARAEPA